MNEKIEKPWSEKPWLVFAGYFYYPNKGFLDFKGSFETKVEADEFVVDLLKCPNKYKYKGRLDWAQIVNLADGSIEYVRL